MPKSNLVTMPFKKLKYRTWKGWSNPSSWLIWSITAWSGLAPASNSPGLPGVKYMIVKTTSVTPRMMGSMSSTRFVIYFHMIVLSPFPSLSGWLRGRAANSFAALPTPRRSPGSWVPYTHDGGPGLIPNTCPRSGQRTAWDTRRRHGAPPCKSGRTPHSTSRCWERRR